MATLKPAIHEMACRQAPSSRLDGAWIKTFQEHLQGCQRARFSWRYSHSFPYHTLEEDADFFLRRGREDQASGMHLTGLQHVCHELVTTSAMIYLVV